MIINFVKFNIQSDKRSKALKAAKKLQICSEKDDGCIRYVFGEHPDETDTLYVIEMWENLQKLNEHMQNEHIQNFDKDAADFLASEPEVMTLQEI